MGGGGILATAGGCLLVVGVVLDILITVLHPSAQSPFSARFYRAAWRVVTQLSAPLATRDRTRVLSWILPGSVAGLLVAWMLGLLAGFALIYAPAMGRPGAFSATLGHLHWPDAFYYSGVCLITVGFGDIVPRWGWLRALAVAEGLSGLLVVGMAITYVLSVFPVLPLARILAITLNEETDGRIHAVPMVRRYLAVRSSEALAQRCRELATSIITLTEAHASHPVLFYAHPRRVELSFLRVLIVTQHLVALLRYGLRAADYPDLSQDPRVVGLEESLIASLRRMGASLHLAVAPAGNGPRDLGVLEQEYDALLERLQAAGLRRDGAPQRVERRRFVRFRLVTDPYIHAYRVNSAYPAGEPWGDYPPLRGTTAPLPSEDQDDEAE